MAIDPERARPAQSVRPGTPAAHEGDNTTHYSVVDRDGNAVANTYTLNFSYGLGLVADGTGILLNNELDDFAAKPGAPNAYGLVGGDANAPGGGKRPLSSMAPTIVLRDGRVFLVTGTPGGSRIITMVLQVILNVVDHQMNVAEAVAAPRIHHQWLPDQVDRRARLLARHAAPARAEGPQDRHRRDLRLGQFDPGDARRPHRRRRPAPARHAGGGILAGYFPRASVRRARPRAARPAAAPRAAGRARPSRRRPRSSCSRRSRRLRRRAPHPRG